MVKHEVILFLVFDSIEEYAPGFKSSVIGRDILTPPDLEKIFGLTGGVSRSTVTVHK
jgi:phytoene dehydrogenase-like protein